jgi:YD repeat-containing protein
VEHRAKFRMPNGFNWSGQVHRQEAHAFDPDGHMTSTVDARGNAAGANAVDFTTSYVYDPAGNQLSMTDPIYDFVNV